MDCLLKKLKSKDRLIMITKNFFILISALLLLRCNNTCDDERFFCRDEMEIDSKKGLKLVKIYYNGEITEEYYSSRDYEKDSFYTDYINGRKSCVLEFENGLQNGLAISFYNNGDTQLVQHYKNDTLNGLCYGFYLNKRIKYKQIFKMGQCVSQRFFDSTIASARENQQR